MKMKYEYIKEKMGSCLSNYFSDKVKHMSDSFEKLIMDSFSEGYHKGLVEGFQINEPSKEWNPASKKPEQSDEYLVTVIVDSTTFVDKFGFTPTDGWYDSDFPDQSKIDWNKYVVAWQEMPKPYSIGGA